MFNSNFKNFFINIAIKTRYITILPILAIIFATGYISLILIDFYDESLGLIFILFLTVEFFTFPILYLYKILLPSNKYKIKYVLNICFIHMFSFTLNIIFRESLLDVYDSMSKFLIISSNFILYITIFSIFTYIYFKKKANIICKILKVISSIIAVIFFIMCIIMLCSFIFF